MAIRWISTLSLTVALSTPAWAAPSFNITYVDVPSGTLASRGWLNHDSLFQQNIRAALTRWGAQFNSDETLVVRVDTTSFQTRAGGGFSYGRFLYTNGQNKQVWEVGALSRMLTGSNAGETFYGYDILLGFDATFLEQYYWFDPQPELRQAQVPANRGDFVSVVLHELGHAFGIGGNRDFASGELHTPAISQFDDLSYYGGDGNPFDALGEPNPLFFGGDKAASIYGSDLPLTHQAVGQPNYSQNFYHLSACDHLAPDGLEGTLMNGCVLPNGERLYITPYDRAVIADLGYPMAPVVPADFNIDGHVDGADLKWWRDAFGRSAAGDADGDGDSDGPDFLTWQRGLSGASVMSVAEPCAAPVAVLGVASIGLFRSCSTPSVRACRRTVPLSRRIRHERRCGWSSRRSGGDCAGH